MIKGLGEEVKEEMVVQKILRSLPMGFNAKVLAIEDMDKLAHRGLVSWSANDLLSRPCCCTCHEFKSCLN